MMQKIFRDQFLKNNIIFFIGSLVAAALNYLYHPIMSRMLTVADFGEMQALISLTYIIGIFLAVYGTVSINIIANSANGSQRITSIFSFVLPIVIVFASGLIIFSPFLRTIFNFKSIVPFLPLAFILLVDAVNTFYGAYLRGTKKFKTVSLMSIISSAGRVIFGVVLVFFGLRVFGAITAFGLATLMSLLYARYKTQNSFQLTFKRGRDVQNTVREEMSYAILVLASIGFITFLYSSDILFAKYYFAPEQSGVYSGISTIARSIFFATASVAGVLMPSVIIRLDRHKNRTVLMKALLINGVICICVMSVFFFFPGLTISLMLGEQYLSMKELLAYSGVNAIFISIVNITYTYYLALRDRRLIWSSIVGMSTLVILMAVHHTSFHALITNYIFSALSTLGVLGIFKYIKTDKKDRIR